MGDELRKKIAAVLHTIHDPEIPVDIYELGLIYDLRIDDGGMVSIRMTLTAPNCPVAGSLPAEVESKVRAVPGVTDVKLELTFDPPWSLDKMSEAAKLALGLDTAPIRRTRP